MQSQVWVVHACGPWVMIHDSHHAGVLRLSEKFNLQGLGDWEALPMFCVVCRAAPLSQGRVDASTGCLQCCYQLAQVNVT